MDAPDGFEHWLLKFDGMGADQELGTTQNYGRIEYAYHLMAHAAGLRMTECRLLKENGRAHFMTKRFDREGTSSRHHMQSLCAMAHVDYKKKGANAYSQLFNTIGQLAPAYDVTFAHNPNGKWTHQHLMSVNGKFKGFEATDMLAEAARFGVGTAKRVIEEARSAVRRWPEFAQQADIPEAQMAEIQALLLPLR